MRSLLYYLYGRRLLRQVRLGDVPRHLGIILDGNRRYALERGVPDLREAYALGAEKLDEVLEWCAEIGIRAVSLWVFSTDNFHRPATEVSGILSAVESYLTRLRRHPRSRRLGLRVRAVGKLDLLPDSTLASIRAAEAATASNRAMDLTFAVAYGGRQEIIDAVQAMLREKSKQGEELQAIIDGVSEETIGQYLYAPDLPDPDLIIRTSGEIRLSGFLLWQSAYSEFYFCDAHWPAFRKVDFLRAVRAYQQRERRFGRLNVLVNNAGIGGGTRIEETTLEDWDRMMAVNATGVFLGTKTAIAAMRRAGGGSIINISSQLGLVGTDNSSPQYQASKGAVRLLTKATAIQYAREGIRANSVHPGPIVTPMTERRRADPAVRQLMISRIPLGRYGEPDEVAYGVLYLASDEAAYVTGSELVIDGGWTAQ